MKQISQPIQRPAPRFLTFWVLSSAVLLLWTVGVFLYVGHNGVVFRSGVWIPPWDLRFQVDRVAHSLREHGFWALGVLLLGCVPRFRAVLLGRARARDTLLLLLALTGLYGLFALDQWGLEREWLRTTRGEVLGLERCSYALLMVAVAGLLGGWRWGLAFGLLHLAVAGTQFYVVQVIPKHPDQPWLRSVLTETWAVVGVWAGLVCGHLGDRMRDSPPYRVTLSSSVTWLERTSSGRVLLSALLLGTALEGVLMVLNLLTTWAPPYHFDRFLHNLWSTGPLLALLAWTWRGLVLRDLQTDPRRLERTQSELKTAQAELRALRAQMNPHFLLNSLSVIHHLIRTEPEQARTLTVDLSDVLRHTLYAGDCVPLCLEIEQTQAYLALEQARYTHRLRVEWQIQTPHLERAVPILTLQPLVENAVKHGIAQRPEGGTVRIVIREEGAHLHLEVEDDGVGFDPQLPALEGDRPHIGLNNIDGRLRLLFGAEYGLQLESRPGAGTRVGLRIPLTGSPLLEQAEHSTVLEESNSTRGVKEIAAPGVS